MLMTNVTININIWNVVIIILVPILFTKTSTVFLAVPNAILSLTLTNIFML